MKKWKPKKFVKSITIDLKTRKVVSAENVYAKSEEEEKQWIQEQAELLAKTWEGILGEELYWKIVNYLQSVKEKHGEEEYKKRFQKLWKEIFIPSLEDKKPNKK